MVFVFHLLPYCSHMIISSCIHVAANGITGSCLWLSSIPLCVQTTFSLSINICWWTFGLFPCFCLLWTGVCVPCWITVSSGYMPGTGLLDHTVILMVFWGASTLSSTVVAPTYISTNSVGEFPFLQTSKAFVIYRLFNDCHSDQYEVGPHWTFDLHCLNN